jgi:hypothetical protein
VVQTAISIARTPLRMPQALTAIHPYLSITRQVNLIVSPAGLKATYGRIGLDI